MRRRSTDAFAARGLQRQVEAIADDVAQRLALLVEREFAGLAGEEQRAALDAVARTFERADLSDRGLFAADVDPAKLVSRLEAAAVPVLRGAGLGEAGAAFFNFVLADTARCFLAIVVALPQFSGRVSVELLRRLSAVDGGIAEVLARLPRPSLDAPAGADLDGDFRARYLALVSAELDTLEMPGLTTGRYRPRTTLTVAYLSLSVTAREASARRRGQRAERLAWLPVREQAGLQRPERDGAVRVEGALAGAARMLIRGAPGCGKTTLLKWLAVTAARGAFEAELREWNGCVPFVVRLREYAEEPLPAPEQLPGRVAPMVAGLMPPAWVHRVLGSGRALLLVDGVDEVAEPRRPAVREWLRRLLREFPGIRVVVTSRPAAAGRDWLRDLGFSAATVESMTPPDVRAFVDRWHTAAADAARTPDALPCPVAELPRHQRRLLTQLDNEPHVRALATTPLLAAMLCALNLERNSQLPRDRIGLYDAALEMMLERRDAERLIPVDQHISLDSRAKTTLLRALAWWLSENGRAEASTDRASEILSTALRAIPAVTASADAVLTHLLTRSGLIREPVPGRIDFVHRTFQEYLTAQEAADRGSSGFLVQRAHLDQWRETITMAAGHGDTAFREELLDGLTHRAAAESRHTRQLRLLAVSCLETMERMDPERQARVKAGLAELLPPRRLPEARSLATAGPAVLRQLPTSLADLPASAAAATVRTTALIHGPDALPLLARYGTDPRKQVQDELIRAWEYFDPQEYAERVLADSPLQDGTLTLTTRTVLPGLSHLRHLAALELIIDDDQVADLDWLRGAPHLRRLNLSWPPLANIDGLAEHRRLRDLSLYTTGPLDISRIHTLTELKGLQLYGGRLIGDLDFRRLRNLRELSLVGVPNDVDLEFLARLNLTALYISGGTPSLTTLSQLTTLTELRLNTPPEGLSLPFIANTWPTLTALTLGTCAGIADLTPLIPLPLKDLDTWGSDIEDLTPLADHQLRSLVVADSKVRRLDPLAHQTALWQLYLGNTPVSDLTPLARLHQLGYLSLDGCQNLTDLQPLTGLRKLRYIWLQGTRPGLDLTPLAGKTITINLYEGQEVYGLDAVSRRATINWLTPPDDTPSGN